MNKFLRVTAATTVGLAALSLTAPAHAGGSAVGAGIIGFGIGAILGNLLTPSEVYVVPSPPRRRESRIRISTIRRLTPRQLPMISRSPGRQRPAGTTSVPNTAFLGVAEDTIVGWKAQFPNLCGPEGAFC